MLTQVRGFCCSTPRGRKVVSISKTWGYYSVFVYIPVVGQSHYNCIQVKGNCPSMTFTMPMLHIYIYIKIHNIVEHQECSMPEQSMYRHTLESATGGFTPVWWAILRQTDPSGLLCGAMGRVHALVVFGVVGFGVCTLI